MQRLNFCTIRYKVKLGAKNKINIKIIFITIILKVFKKFAGAKVLCNDNRECTEGAQCMIGNDTSLPGRRCWCLSGYEIDEDRLCSGEIGEYNLYNG